MRIQLATAAMLSATLAFAGAQALAQTPNYTPGAQDSQMTNQQSSQMGAQPTPVTSLSDAKSKLASKSVKDSQGAAIGEVKSVEMDSSGQPQTVRVSLTKNKRTVAIPASSLNYDSTSGTIQASMSKTEIESLPKSSTTSY
jgi:hypothetical protein